MEAAAATAHDHTAKGIRRLLSALTHFQLSDKFKFAVKASLSLALVYLIALSQGWNNAATAATTIMIIAATESLGDSVMKGLLRVIGTLIGAVTGMILIGIFPQDRELYLLSASVIVTILLYFARAYKGDMTIFLLTAITLMTIFKNGEVDDVFLYGVDKTFMTVFGIVIYTLVGIFLWPVSTKDDSMEQAASLTEAQKELFQSRDADRETRTQKHQQTLQIQQALTQTLGRINSSIQENFSPRQWESVLRDYKEITQHLTLLSYHDEHRFSNHMKKFIPNISQLEKEIGHLFETIAQAWKNHIPIKIPDAFKPTLDHHHLERLSELECASLSSTLSNLEALHTHLRTLAAKLNALNTPQPTWFPIDKSLQQESRFFWFDVEHLKASLVTFLIFWTGSLLWIYFNPPGGFMLVSLAAGLSVITAFTPVRPSLMIIIFTLAFVFATLMYILVLPNLSYGWELGMFIFLYGFIGFYFINLQISIFFLLGLLTLNITNEMYYAFDLFLLTLVLFYAFLFLLLFFYYIPFSTKPEHMFLTMKDRLFRYAATLLEHNRNRIVGKSSLVESIAAAYAKHHLMSTVKKMQLWASQIDTKYFDAIEKKKLLQFTKSCETFIYLLLTMYSHDRTNRQNPLVRDFLTQNSQYALVPLLRAYAKRTPLKDIDTKWRNKEVLMLHLEKKLQAFGEQQKKHDYTPEEIMQFYTTISLHKNVWSALFTCSEEMTTLDLNVLEESRF